MRIGRRKAGIHRDVTVWYQGSHQLPQLQHVLHLALVKHAEELDPDLGVVFRDGELTLDCSNTTSYIRMSLEYRGKERFRYNFDPMNQEVKKLAAETISVVRQNLFILSSMHFVRLQKHFPKTILDVTAEMNQETREKRFKVAFKNGHVLDATESELQDEMFVAKCLMVHDLPPL